MAYIGANIIFMTNSQPTNQDILTAVKDLSKIVGEMAVDLTDMQGDIKTLKADVSTLKTDTSTLKSQMIEVQDEQEHQGKKLDQITASPSFSPFSSGALVA